MHHREFLQESRLAFQNCLLEEAAGPQNPQICAVPQLLSG
jgi:hypothetical protein